MKNHDTVIIWHISNDPSFELNPTLGKEINLDSFEPLVKSARDNQITHFIYASSSVYRIKNEENVNEYEFRTINDYSKFKADCEKILLKYK